MLETTFFYAAALGGSFLALQLLLTFLGGDDGALDGGDVDPGADLDTGLDAELSTDGGGPGYWFFEIVSLKTLAAAATFFGLTGMTALSYGFSTTSSGVLATAAGAAAMYVVYWLFKQLYRLQSSGTQQIRRAIGLPAQGAGLGKVHLTQQRRTIEYQALTDEEESFAAGEKVVVVAVVDDTTVRVARPKE